MQNVLIIGYGNPGRLDDGLGPALVGRLEERALPGVSLDSDYQLQVEVADALRQHDLVVFVDAAVSGPEPFRVAEVQPSDGASFSTHSVSPGQLLGLSRRLFQAQTRAFVVAIRGYQFDDFGERISPRAQQNLQAAFEFLERVLSTGNLAELESRARTLPHQPDRD